MTDQTTSELFELQTRRLFYRVAIMFALALVIAVGAFGFLR